MPKTETDQLEQEIRDRAASSTHRPPLAVRRVFDLMTVHPNLGRAMLGFIQDYADLPRPQAARELSRRVVAANCAIPLDLRLGILALKLLGPVSPAFLEWGIGLVAKQFIAGRTIEKALPGLKANWKQGRAATVNLLGEFCASEEVADAARDDYVHIIEQYSEDARNYPHHEVLDADYMGRAPRANVSVKLSQISPHFESNDEELAVRDTLPRFEPIAEAARDHGVSISIDMEHASCVERTLSIFRTTRERIVYHGGVILQCYLHRTADDAANLIEWCRNRGYLMTARLVKGAYWSQEVAAAERLGLPCTLYTKKADTHANFERIAGMLLDASPTDPNGPGVKLSLGTHNIRSIAAVVAMARQRGLPDTVVEPQLLEGMGGEIKDALCGLNLRIREYCPVGDMITGMAYLSRRMMDSTEADNWLR